MMLFTSRIFPLFFLCGLLHGAQLEAAQIQTCQGAVMADNPDEPSFSMKELQPGWRGRMRVKALRNLDQFLNWSVSEKLKSYTLLEPPIRKSMRIDVPELKTFAEEFGYFSLTQPLIGKVSKGRNDIDVVSRLLKALYQKGQHADEIAFSTAEVLSKALAYRDLKKGQSIAIPIVIGREVALMPFVVDQVFNLWHGMPAFGLVPQEEGISAILLFRGTDLSLDSQRGWASLMSDLDTSGPGLSAFQHAQDEIHEWLQQVASQNKRARMLGFSLGGALAAYTFIYENEEVAEEGSIAFCPPGVSDKVIAVWRKLPEERKKGFTTYVNQGDIISKVGKLFGVVYALEGDRPLKPVSAHNALMSAKPRFSKAQVDLRKENKGR